jgi:carboxyl-terminal processing protease
MRQKLFRLFLALTILMAGILIGSQSDANSYTLSGSPSEVAQEKMQRLLNFIEEDYVDAVNTDSIVTVTINEILDKLDPHSVYIPKTISSAVAEQMQGDFVGIGVNFYRYKDSVAVIRTVAGGPSEKAGIQAGDRILLAQGDTLYGNNMPNDQLVQKLKGPINTEVGLRVFRKKDHSFQNFTLKRDRIPIVSVSGYCMLDSSLGYLKINRFAATTYDEFSLALAELKASGAQELILDLRDNLGGYMGMATQISDDFLSANTPIVYTKNKKGTTATTLANAGGAFENKQVYVLVNERSASASEIIAGALQDNDIGTIIGRRTFGKGLVQREMPLGDGSSVRLTIARYYTPTGRSIQKPYGDGDYESAQDRYATGELQYKDSMPVIDSLAYTTPKGKIVYGGGGIIPDVFVPIEDNAVLVVKELERLGVFSFFSFEQLDAHRSDYQDWTEAGFVKDFQVPETLYQDFVTYLKNAGVALDTKDHKVAVLLELKAALAYQLFGDNAVLKIRAAQDPMVQKALALKNQKSQVGAVNNIHLLSDPSATKTKTQTTNDAENDATNDAQNGIQNDVENGTENAPKETVENRES